jgi:site-specific DNA-methyltransferase (adenine-specific)
MTKPYTLLRGDTLRLLLELPASSVDAVVTDCPYSSGGMTRGDRTAGTKSKYVQTDSKSGHALPEFQGDTRDQRSFAHWCALWYADCLRASQPGALLFSFTDWRQLPSTTDAVQAGGWVWRGIVPWNKTEASRPQKGRPRAQCEYIVFATKGPHAPWIGAPAIPGFFEVPTPRERMHIAEKPVGLMLELLSIVPPGGLVLDPFCGSASTGIAALRLKLRVLLFEIDQGIADRAESRLEAELQGLSLFDAERGQLSLAGGEN